MLVELIYSNINIKCIIDEVTGDVNAGQFGGVRTRMAISFVLCPVVCVRIIVCSGPVLMKLLQHFIK